METVFERKKVFWIVLILIFFVALAARILWLGKYPATFFVDEVLSGYLGRYLWTNGVDLYGNAWPMWYFNKFGDYYIIAPMYLDGLSTFLFGVTRFATRFPTALFGALTIFPLAGISYAVFRKKTIALLSALLLALMPWHIVLSRATTESVIELALYLTSVCALFRAEQTRKLRWLTIAFLFSIGAYLIYHTARVLVPLTWLGFLLIYFSSLKKHARFLGCAVIFFLFSVGLTFYIGSTPWGKGRFAQVSILSEQSGVSIRMTEMTYNLGNNALLLARVFQNKVLGYGREFLNQYLSYFSPLYLFSSDGWLSTRYAVPEMGPLMLALLVALASMLLPAKKPIVHERNNVLFLLWILLISVVPASFTVIESPNIRRSLTMIAPLILFAGVGWYRSFFIGRKYINLGVLLSGVFLAESILFGYYYFFQSDRLSSMYRNDGLPEIASYLVEEEPNYKQALVFDSLDFPLYYLFAKQDFSKTWSEKFRQGLLIDAMGAVSPRQEKCALDLPDKAVLALSQSTQFIEPVSCTYDPCRLRQIDQITGVNTIYTHFRVLTFNDEESLKQMGCAVVPKQYAQRK